MKMLNYQGGYSIAVYPTRAGKRITKAEQDKKKLAEQLVVDNRAKFVTEANFEKPGPLYDVVTMLIRRMVDEQSLNMNLNA